MDSYSIFIVEDDIWYGEILEYHLSLNPEYTITRFSTGTDCLKALHQKPDLITIDYALPDMKGCELLRRIKESHPEIPVIAISSQENITTAIQLLKAGAKDYFIKDENAKDLLWDSIITLRELAETGKVKEESKLASHQNAGFENTIKGNSSSIKKVFSIIEKACKTNINVSITGETGTGKELVAKAIHFNSPRSKHPFVTINMSAIPSELIESELFGHEKGAFTGAIARKKGKFEEANSGTLFLDEIAELDLNLQSKLLRVLQEREVTRVGGNESIPLDLRIVVATHKNLAEEVEKGTFREDLYYRIMGLTIDLPPLRERGDDITLLADYFLSCFEKENKLSKLSFSPAARQKITAYSYPGNVRELKTVIELAAVMCNGTEIEPEDISFKAIRKKDTFLSEEKKLKDYNLEIIQSYLRKYNNNVIKVAEKLDIGKSTIYKMIQLKELCLYAG